jgi:hypothetical protein
MGRDGLARIDVDKSSSHDLSQNGTLHWTQTIPFRHKTLDTSIMTLSFAPGGCGNDSSDLGNFGLRQARWRGGLC